MPSRSIPPPPRALLVGLGLITALCFLTGFLTGRTKGPRHPALGKTTLEITLREEAGARQLEGELQKKGLAATFQAVQGTVRVPSGFIVAESLNTSAAKPAAEALSKVHHLQVSLRTESKERTLVQVGPAYKSEAEAKKMVAQLEAIGYKWHVTTNYSEKPGENYKLTISNVPADKAEELKKELSMKGISVKVTQTH